MGVCKKVASDLGFVRGFFLGAPVFSTSYNWFVMN